MIFSSMTKSLPLPIPMPLGSQTLPTIPLPPSKKIRNLSFHHLCRQASGSGHGFRSYCARGWPNHSLHRRPRLKQGLFRYILFFRPFHNLIGCCWRRQEPDRNPQRQGRQTLTNFPPPQPPPTTANFKNIPPLPIRQGRPSRDNRPFSCQLCLWHPLEHPHWSSHLDSSYRHDTFIWAGCHRDEFEPCLVAWHWKYLWELEYPKCGGTHTREEV